MHTATEGGSAAVAALAAAPAPLRKHITQELRIRSEYLELPDGHHAVLRDQRSPGSRRLERHLKDIGEAEWLALLDARVFLFTREPDVRRLLDAYKAEGQDVIKLKTAALLAACQGLVEVTTSPTAQNAGSGLEGGAVG
jgi:hypothetical protein